MTSQFEEFQRDYVNWSSRLYRCANSELSQKLVKLDQNTPCDMRAPGAATGWRVSKNRAMDELAYAAKIDPLELRLINYSDKDQIEECLTPARRCGNAIGKGAEKFGWRKRTHAAALDARRSRTGRLGHGHRHVGSDAS